MKKLLISLAAMFAAIPGLATMLSGLGVPPGYSIVFGAVTEAVGALAFLLVMVNKPKLLHRRLTNSGRR